MARGTELIDTAETPVPQTGLTRRDVLRGGMG
jgi:hypothetical protein